MAGADAVHSEKRVSRRTFRILLAIGVVPLLLTLGSLAAFVFGGDPQGLGGAAIMGSLTLFLGVLAFALPVARTTVTRTDLRFMIGLRLVRVPLGSITSTSIGALDPTTIRAQVAEDRAQLASIFDAAGRYVRIAWRDESGSERVAWIGSDDADSLLEAIARAKSGSSNVRVDATGLPADDETVSVDNDVANKGASNAR